MMFNVFFKDYNLHLNRIEMKFKNKNKQYIHTIKSSYAIGREQSIQMFQLADHNT